MLDESNPVVLLNGSVWHIAEDGRRSRRAHCGQPLNDRRAHSRLRTVGAAHVCPACRRRYAADFPGALDAGAPDA